MISRSIYAANSETQILGVQKCSICHFKSTLKEDI